MWPPALRGAALTGRAPTLVYPLPNSTALPAQAPTPLDPRTSQGAPTLSHPSRRAVGSARPGGDNATVVSVAHNGHRGVCYQYITCRRDGPTRAARVWQTSVRRTDCLTPWQR